MVVNFAHQQKVQEMKNDLILEIAILKHSIREQILIDYNWFALMPLQENLCLKEYYLKELNLGRFASLPYGKCFLSQVKSL